MSQRNTVIVVDTGNLMRHVTKKFNGRKIDYTKYVEQATGDDILFAAKAYGSPATDPKSENFRRMLKSQGFNLSFTDPLIINDRETGEERKIYVDHCVAISVDVLDLVATGKIDRLVIGSGAPELSPLVERVRRAGVIVDIFASCITRRLKDVANSSTEIGEDCLFSGDVK
jgi:uncharacterized LabA/DUF88 family protein